MHGSHPYSVSPCAPRRPAFLQARQTPSCCPSHWHYTRSHSVSSDVECGKGAKGHPIEGEAACSVAGREAQVQRTMPEIIAMKAGSMI